MASTTSSATASGSPCGFQPMASAIADSSAIWITSTHSTHSALATISPQRGSGVAPMRLSTP